MRLWKEQGHDDEARGAFARAPRYINSKLNFSAFRSWLRRLLGGLLGNGGEFSFF
jgi:hypothetical protein